MMNGTLYTILARYGYTILFIAVARCIGIASEARGENLWRRLAVAVNQKCLISFLSEQMH